MKLEDIKNAYIYEGKGYMFDKWSVIHNYLERQCIGTNVAPLPTTTDQALPPGSPTGPPATTSPPTEQVLAPTEQLQVDTDLSTPPGSPTDLPVLDLLQPHPTVQLQGSVSPGQ